MKAAQSGCQPSFEMTEDQIELSKILRSVQHDPSMLGVVCLGRDGVYRSLTAERNVVDAAPLTPRLITALQARLPSGMVGDDLADVDGTTVPREKWFNPDKNLLPEPMAKDRLDESRKKIEEKRARGELKQWDEDCARREELSKARHAGYGSDT
jgi:hypothetical protein